jgi:hypothetical protein
MTAGLTDTQAPEDSAALPGLLKEWELVAGRYDRGGIWVELRSGVSVLQCVAGIFATFGAMPILAAWLILPNEAGWLARVTPPLWSVIAAAVVSAPMFLEMSIHERLDHVLRSSGYLPNYVGPPLPTALPPPGMLEGLRLGSVACRHLNDVIHTLAIVGLGIATVVWLDGLLVNASPRALRAAVLVLLAVLASVVVRHNVIKPKQ